MHERIATVNKYDSLKPKQQEYIANFFTGLMTENRDSNGKLDETFEIQDEYTRVFLRYMSSKYCDMEWAPAWIVKDKSRQVGVGIYSLPEVVEFADHVATKQEELPADDGETMIIGTQVVQA